MSLVISPWVRGTTMVPTQDQQYREHDQAEIRLMGLILTQAVSIGIAIGIFDAALWIDLDDPVVNGVTYSMAAFAVQGLAYYLFKMFFQQGMDERMHMQEGERRRQQRYRGMQQVFDGRREDLELRMQEAQLENELRWMETNPGKAPTWAALENEEKLFNPAPPTHNAVGQEAMNLGMSFKDEEEEEGGSKERSADGKFKKKSE